MSISKTISIIVGVLVCIMLSVILPYSMAAMEVHKSVNFPPNELPDTFGPQSQFSLNFGSVLLSFLAIVLLITLVTKNNQNRKKTNLRTIPRVKSFFPIRIPIIEGIYGMIRARRDGVKMLEDLGNEFGKVYELPFALTAITMVADLSVVQAILSSTQPEHLNRPQVSIEILRSIFRNGLFTSDYKTWSVQRKILNRSFTHKSLQHYLVFMNEHSKQLAKSLMSAAEVNHSTGDCCIEGEQVPELLYCYAFKTIAHTIMGTDGISEAKSAEITHAFNTFKDLLIHKLMNPLSFYLKKRKYDQLHEYIRDFISNTIQNYKNVYELEQKNDCGREEVDTEDEKDIGLKPFRCMIEELICSEMTNEEIYDQVATFLGAGHETTVTSTKLFLFNLALNPEHQAKCRQEIDAMLDEKLDEKSHDDFNISLNMEDIQNLKYLERCIMESSRVLTSTPVFLRHLDAPLKVTDDLEFAAGTNLAINVWQINKDEEQYPNPEKFDPDRFLPENVLKRHAYSYVPFSLGVRNCIGFKLATLHIKIIAVWILRNFEIFTDDKVEDVKLLFGITTVPERNYNLILRKRTLI